MHTHTQRWLRLWVTPVEGTHCLWWAYSLPESWGQLHPLPVMYQYTCIALGLGPSHLNTGNRIMEVMVSLCNKELWSWTDLIFKETPWGTPTLTVAPKTLCLEIFLSAPYSTMVPKKPALEWQNQELLRHRRHLNFSCNSQTRKARKCIWLQQMLASGRFTVYLQDEISPSSLPSSKQELLAFLLGMIQRYHTQVF